MDYNKFLFNLYFLIPVPLAGFVLRLIQKREGGQMYSATLREIFKKKYKINIGYGSYGGCFNPSNVPKNVTFGNYCSIARNIKILRANHPKAKFTTHPILYNPVAGYVKKDMLDRRPLYIGNDVWIGEGTIILPSVTNIGNGAIIGAGSIVTKDVPSYKVVAGNPAREIAQRFDDKTISDLEATKWWLLDRDGLIKNIGQYDAIISQNSTVI